MAWEQRGNQTYYYRSVRSGTRVTKQYLGGGLVGSLMAELDAEHRAEHAQERSRLDAERARWSALEALASRLDDLTDAASTVELLNAGYRRHDRGEWRRRRG